jgi:hypothetical protein
MLVTRNPQENQSSFNRAHLGVVDALRPGSMFDFDASPVTNPAQAPHGQGSFVGLTVLPLLDDRGFGDNSNAARLRVFHLGNDPGPATETLQSTLGSYGKLSPIGTCQIPITKIDLHMPDKMNLFHSTIW